MVEEKKVIENDNSDGFRKALCAKIEANMSDKIGTCYIIDEIVESVVNYIDYISFYKIKDDIKNFLNKEKGAQNLELRVAKHFIIQSDEEGDYLTVYGDIISYSIEMFNSVKELKDFILDNADENLLIVDEIDVRAEDDIVLMYSFLDEDYINKSKILHYKMMNKKIKFLTEL